LFTGIIEELGTIKNIENGKIEIIASKVLEGSKLGDSIAVNGICLTVTNMTKTSFCADVMNETINRTSLSSLSSGSKVNLERAMAADGRFSGHIVSGHIDGTAVVNDIKKDDNAYWYTIKAGTNLLDYIVEKGSITIDGISLTVAYVSDSVFKVSIIPHTRKVTNLHTKAKGDLVNIECDIIGKYVEKLLYKKDNPYNKNDNSPKSNITLDFLRENGF